MSFLSPLFLFGALTAAVPIVLHLLKRQPETRVKFAAVKLLRQAPVEDTQRRRLRELLLLAARVAALVLLATAFARPFLASGAANASGRVTVIALDTSLSMSAPGRFDRARQLAKDAISRAPAGSLVAVVTFADAAQTVTPPTADRALAVAAVEAAAPGFGATHYRAALATASDLIDRHGAQKAAIVVVTDLQATGWDASDRASIPESANVEVADVGALPSNLSVLSAALETDRVVATIRNSSDRPRDAHVRLTVDDRPVSESTASIGPNQTTEVVLPGARGGTASVVVDDPDGVQGDNVRYLVLDNAGRPSVLVVTTNGDLPREAFYVQQALLAAGRDGAKYEVEGVAGGQLAGWDEARMNRHAAVLVISTRTLESHGRDLLSRYVRQGGGVFIPAGAETDGEVVGEISGGAIGIVAVPNVGRPGASEPRTLAPADIRHPVFQAFGAGAATLSLARFRQIAEVSGKDCQTLARFTTGETALVDCAAGEGRMLAFASDLDNRWNDFPVHATFVPFLHEAVRYLAGGHPRGSEYLVGEVPAGVPARPGIASLADPARSAGSNRIAVNVDPAESDPERLTPDEFQAAVTRLKDAGRAQTRVEARQQEERQHIWQYVLALMLGMLAIEGFLASRTA